MDVEAYTGCMDLNLSCNTYLMCDPGPFTYSVYVYESIHL